MSAAWRVVALACLFLFLSSVVNASIPSEDGRIYACYNAAGTVRLVDPLAGCRANETSISWRQENTPLPMTLLASIEGDGAGTVEYAAGNRVCATDCVLSVPVGTTVTLSARSDPWSQFAGWQGDCSGTGNCTVTLNDHRAVRALFTKRTEWVVVGATGAGTLTSSPAGIDCPGDCMASFPYGTEVTLTATPAPGAGQIGGFAGVRCIRAPVNACTFVADETVLTEVRFDPVQLLTYTQSVSGRVTVSPQPAFCDPPGDLRHCYYVRDTHVTLRAFPDPGRVFVGWFGDCTGTGDCNLVMDTDHDVHASFALAWTLSVAKSGSGSGTVTSSPAGIDCGSDCSSLFMVNSVVTLTATPAPGSHFSHWSDACTGTNLTCSVTMGFDHRAIAWFELDS